MNYLLLLPLSLAIASILMPLLRKWGIKYHLCDEPGKDRLKIHQKPIPYLGGIGIFITMVIALLMIAPFKKVSLLQIIGLVLGGGLIILLGVWDDFKWKRLEPRPLLKLLGQSLAALLVFSILIKTDINFPLSISPILIVLIGTLYLVGAMNAMNMEDGMDGLAGGLCFISLLGFTALSLVTANLIGLCLCLILMGAVLGFLIYNWHPASMFMGDNGSHFLGFALVILAMMFTGHLFYNFQWFIGPILIIGLPVFDAGWAIVRRLSKGKSPFSGDRGHVYDKIYVKCRSTKKTVLVCYFIQTIFTLGGLLLLRLT